MPPGMHGNSHRYLALSTVAVSELLNMRTDFCRGGIRKTRG